MRWCGARSLSWGLSRSSPPARLTPVASGNRHAAQRDAAQLLKRAVLAADAIPSATGKADDPVVTSSFRAAPGGRVLARATQIIAPGAPHGSCEPMTLTTKGHPQIPLLGGAALVRAVQRVLGVRLPRG
jgi:hypothetical protein